MEVLTTVFKLKLEAIRFNTNGFVFKIKKLH